VRTECIRFRTPAQLSRGTADNEEIVVTSARPLSCSLEAVNRSARAEVNAIIAAAIDSWPLPARLRRLSVPVLAYRDDDFDAYAIALVHCAGRSEGAPVGVVARCLETSVADGSYLFVHGLYLLPALQRRGIGRELLGRLEGEAVEARARGVLVKAERVALPFFLGAGYAQLAPGEGPGGDYPYRCWRELSPQAR
jgi:GNAT superfamily N-acetyltransferase